MSKAKKSKKPPPNKMRRIKLFFTPEDKNTIKKWFGCVRKTYNWALGCIKAKPKEYKLDSVWLRTRFINANNVPNKYKYILDCPKDIRDGAIDDLVSAFKVNKAKCKEDPTFRFDVSYRSKKDMQSIKIGVSAAGFLKNNNKHTEHWSHGQFRIFPTCLKDIIGFYTRNKDIKNNKQVLKPAYDCRLVMDKLGNIYLHVPMLETGCDNQAPKEKSIASIDPGVRTFLTVYSDEKGKAYKLGDKDIGRIIRLCLWMDKLQSKISLAKNHRKRYSLNKAMIRLRLRIKHLVDEAHWKYCKFLVSNFTTIYLPIYNSSKMVSRKARKINSKTARMMMNWRFFAFKQKLQHRASLSGVEVIDCTEEYTSKTCSQCHSIKENLGGSKVYHCDRCNLSIDRDVNGARNILVKNYFKDKVIKESNDNQVTPKGKEIKGKVSIVDFFTNRGDMKVSSMLR